MVGTSEIAAGGWTGTLRFGVPDCERVLSDIVAQPVNTVSSLAFVAVGALFWKRDRVLAISVAMVGVGSVWFHAQLTTPAARVHDVAIVLGVLLIIHRVWRANAWRHIAPGLAILSVGVVVWWFSRTGGAWCNPDSVLQLHALWHVLAALAIATLRRRLLPLVRHAV